MNRLLIISLIGILFGGLASCDDFNTMPERDTDYTSTYPLNGEYWVQYTNQDDGSPWMSGYGLLVISNTAANNGDSVIIDAHDAGFKIKAAANVENKSFQVENANDMNSNDQVTVTGGKVFVDQATTPEGHVTDSLYMELEFASDPGNIVVCKGNKETGFNDDNH